MAVAERKRQTELIGREKPRLAPPTPARSKVALFEQSCRELEIEPFPWQLVVARYLYALGIGDHWLYPDVTELVGRQNGKTEIVVPHVVTRLRMGRRIMHTAQDRALPREVFRRVVTWGYAHRDELAAKPRLANGQEEIVMRNGGRYRIVAPTDSGARGPSNDDLIVDEIREQDDYGFMAAAEPTLTASADPQAFFLSNAGDDDSVVLNDLRRRAAEDPALAWLEWSAAPERRVDDHLGWAEANPSIGHLPGILPYLERKYESYRLAGKLAIFETEHLCRWVSTLRETLVSDNAWSVGRSPLGKALRPMLAVSLAPEGTRASIAMAWKAGENIALTLIEDNVGTNLATDPIAERVRDLASRHGATVGFDPMTDAALVKFVPKAKTAAINGAKYASASAEFAGLVHSERLKWANADAVTDDLTWTARKPDGEQGSYHAVRAQDDRPITASFAAIRAVWLASLGRTAAPPRIR